MVVKLTLYFILLSLIFTSCNYHSDFEYDNFLSACKNGDLEKVKIFVEKGLDVNYKRCKGHGMKAKYCESPLKIAVYHENIELCEFLISNNADPNQTKKIVIEGYSYLKSALNIIKGKRHNIKNINKNPNEMEKQLLLYFMNDGNASLNTDNINPNVIDENGKHLIEYVIENQYFIILPSLFIEGADPNYTTYNNYTLLNLLEDKYEIYKILYELHGNQQAQNGRVARVRQFVYACEQRSHLTYPVDVYPKGVTQHNQGQRPGISQPIHSPERAKQNLFPKNSSKRPNPQ